MPMPYIARMAAAIIIIILLLLIYQILFNGGGHRECILYDELIIHALNNYRRETARQDAALLHIVGKC